jgi:hypothetical protein
MRSSRRPLFTPTTETSDYPPVKALLCNCEIIKGRRRGKREKGERKRKRDGVRE